MYYQIKETLTPCTIEDIIGRKPGDPPYVVITDPETWNRTKDQFDMVIDMEMDPSDVLDNLDKMHATLNEKREAYGYEARPEPWADLPMIPMSTVFGGEGVNDVEEPEE